MYNSPMTEFEAKIVCWSCDKIETECDCEDGFKPKQVIPPKEILPFCGGTIYIDEPWADSKRYKEVMLRPCCNCQEMWFCDHNQQVNGKCPNCGHSGADG